MTGNGLKFVKQNHFISDQIEKFVPLWATSIGKLSRMIHGPSTLISQISKTIATRCGNGSVAVASAAVNQLGLDLKRNLRNELTL